MVDPTGAIHTYGGDFSDYSNFSRLDRGVSVCRSFDLEERRTRYVDLDCRPPELSKYPRCADLNMITIIRPAVVLAHKGWSLLRSPTAAMAGPMMPGIEL